MPRFLSLLVALGLLLQSPLSSAGENCSGRVINPVTDICWTCIFPVRLGKSVRLSKTGMLPDADTNAPSFCMCDLKPGLNMSFWEPIRTVEIVRTPGCSPSLGGIKLPTVKAPSYNKVHRKKRDDATRRHTAFYQVHWFVTPWLFTLEVLLDQACLEQAPWDLAYMSELDPLWNDSVASFVLQPDSAQFANPLSVAACTADCVAASVGLPINTLYWCSGCQGSLFPLTGWVASATSHVKAWMLLAHRFAVKMAREGLLWSAHGREGQCGPYIQPLLQKDVWRMELLYPGSSGTKTFCAPLGRGTAIGYEGRTTSPGGEDGVILMWRRRDCCASPSTLMKGPQ